MSMKMVIAKDTVSGVIGEVPESYLTHPVLGKTLVKSNRTDKNDKLNEPAGHEEKVTHTAAHGNADKASAGAHSAAHK